MRSTLDRLAFGGTLMRILSAVACALLLVGYTTAARADSLETFDVNAATVGGSSISGTLTFDSTTSTFTNSDLTTTLGPITGAPSESGNNPDSVYEGFGPYGSGIYVVFNIPGSSLAGYSGGDVCSTLFQDCGVASSFLFNGYSADQFTTGSLTLQSSPPATPEPSSFLLLGTGLASMIAAMRRRRA